MPACHVSLLASGAQPQSTAEKKKNEDSEWHRDVASMDVPGLCGIRASLCRTSYHLFDSMPVFWISEEFYAHQAKQGSAPQISISSRIAAVWF